MRPSLPDSPRPTGQRRPHPSDSCVLLSVRGVPSWGAVLIAVVIGIGGTIASRALDFDSTSWIFAVFFIGGIALAVLAVRRGSIFTSMVQAPILLTVLVFGVHRFVDDKGTFVSATDIVASFPTMAISTGVGLLLGLVRIIAQPSSRSVPAVEPERYEYPETPVSHYSARAGYPARDDQNTW